MPELPEVETVRRSLAPHLVGRTIATATLNRNDMVAGERSPHALLQGAKIQRLDRRGKQLAIIARDGRVLIVQLGMSGQMLITKPLDPLPTHTHAVWTTGKPATAILFRDPRRFGGLTTLATVDQLSQVWATLGPDGLNITGDDLWKVIHTSNRPIKAALLDQSVVAGVGNIYTDESLFGAGIHPKANCARLSQARIKRLARSVVRVLTQAVEARGSTLRDYRDADGQAGSYVAMHRVYGRASLPCTVCGLPLSRTVVAQRTTVFCRRCQKL